MNAIKHVRNDVRHVEFQPPSSYALDIEIISVDKLRQRKGREFLSTIERIDFHLLIYVTKNSCTHIVDFAPVHCQPGSILLLHPGQMHSFDAHADWQGWLILFRPEFLLPVDVTSIVAKLNVHHQLDELPHYLTLAARDQNIVLDSIHRMLNDTQMDFNPTGLNILLQNQLHALLNRLHLIATGQRPQRQTAPGATQRFRRYCHAVEKHFHHWHRVAFYSHHLGFSEKTLNRVVQEHAGLSAKAFLSKRIALEAKRYLNNTSYPVSTIAYKLGFDEVTNFIKFFKREAGYSPGAFRRRLNKVPVENHAKPMIVESGV